MSSVQAYSGTPWTYDFAGDDWLGTDAAGTPWICLTGKQQSPVNLPVTAGTSSTAIAPEHVTSWQLGTLTSNGSNVAIANNGHSVQLSWSDPAAAPKVMVALQENSPWLSNLDLQRGNRVQTVTAVPQQLHWHSQSEHLVAGRMYPLEAHLVSVVPQSALPGCPPEGCTLVTAVLYELADGDMQANNTWLEPLFNIMPYVEGQAAFLPAGSQLDLQQLVPSDNTSYIAYAGSLTTPPCTEGVLWNVFLSPSKLSVQQKSFNDFANNSMMMSKLSLGDVDAVDTCCAFVASYCRLPQLLNGRVLRVWRDAGSRKKPLLPDDAAKAAGAGVVAGIVLGTVVGATLTGVIGFYAYKTYQRRRLKRLYNMAVSSNDMMMVQQEVENQWLREGAASSDHHAAMGSSTAISSAQQLAARMSPRNPPSAAVL
eukprot:gene5414-5647_t